MFKKIDDVRPALFVGACLSALLLVALYFAAASSALEPVAACALHESTAAVHVECPDCLRARLEQRKRM